MPFEQKWGKKILQKQHGSIYIYMYMYTYIYFRRRYIYIYIYVFISEINLCYFHLGPSHHHLGPSLIPCLLMVSQLLPWPLCLVSTQGKLWNLQEPVNTQKAGKKYHWKCENIILFLLFMVSLFQLVMVFC